MQNIPFVTNATLESMEQKLILLFVLEKMSFPLSEANILDVCTSENEWLSYMECKQNIVELLDANLIYRLPKNDFLSVTQSGISCINVFYARIPLHIRDEITSYVVKNRVRFKKRQSYFCDYSKNADGSYTVTMRVNNDMSTLMELKLTVADRQRAKYIYKNWIDKASSTYSMLQDTLLDGAD